MKQVLLEKFSTRDSDDPLWPHLMMERISLTPLEEMEPGDHIKMKTTDIEYLHPLKITLPAPGGKIKAENGEYESNYQEFNIYITDEVEKATGIRSYIEAQSRWISKQHDAVIEMRHARDILRHSNSEYLEGLEKWSTMPIWKFTLTRILSWI